MKGKRQLSNKGNIVCMILGITLTLVWILQILYSLFCLKRKWPEQILDLICLFIGIVGIIIVAVSVINMISVVRINKYLKSPAYGLDYQKELSTYIIIGREKCKIKNGASKFCKYTEWKEYIEKEFKGIVNDEDAYHFMIRRLRSQESYKELLVAAVIPVELGILSVFYSAGLEVSEIGTIISILLSAAFLIIMAAKNYYDCKNEIDFISDFIEIVFPKINKKQSDSYEA